MTYMCTRPWQAIEIHSGGNAKVCCWNNNSIGNIHSQSVLEIWNGPAMCGTRQAMLEGRIDQMCPKWCPRRLVGEDASVSISARSHNRGNQRNREQLAEDFAHGRTMTLGRPVEIRILPTMACNLHCLMCSQDRAEQDVAFSRYDLGALMPTLRLITAVGGEPLLSRDFLTFASHLNVDKYPDCKITMVTNGLFMTRQFLHVMPGRFSWVGVSIDGATKDTYEGIRVGASWERLIDNVQSLMAFPDRDFPVSILFTIMKYNYHELAQAREFARSVGAKFSIHPVIGRRNGQQIDKLPEIDAILNATESWVNDSGISTGGLRHTRLFYSSLRDRLVNYEKYQGSSSATRGRTHDLSR